MKKASRRKNKWLAQVTTYSDAMDVEAHMFTKSPTVIARSLKEAAQRSRRRKAPPFRSAMSMLTFYSNRAGENLTSAQHKKLDAAKQKLLTLFGRERPIRKTFKR